MEKKKELTISRFKFRRVIVWVSFRINYFLLEDLYSVKITINKFHVMHAIWDQDSKRRVLEKIKG